MDPAIRCFLNFFFFNPAWNPPLQFFSTWYLLISLELVFWGKRDPLANPCLMSFVHLRLLSSSFKGCCFWPHLAIQGLPFLRTNGRDGHRAWGDTVSCQRQVQREPCLSGFSHILICPYPHISDVSETWVCHFCLFIISKVSLRVEEFLIHPSSWPLTGG